MLNAKPIRLDTGLLVYLDYLKRENLHAELVSATYVLPNTLFLKYR